MKKLLRTLVVLVSFASASPLFAWWKTHTASTYIGELAPGQTLVLDLIRGMNAHTYLSLVDTNTEQTVFQVYKWNSFNAEASAAGGTTFTLDNNGDYSIAYLENLPATGDYRLDLRMEANTDSVSSIAYTYFDGTYGGLWIEAGWNAQAWGGTDIYLQ